MPDFGILWRTDSKYEKAYKRQGCNYSFVCSRATYSGRDKPGVKLYGMQPLYAKDKRDACMIVAINNRKYQLFEIDDMLVEQGLKKLSPDEKNNTQMKSSPFWWGFFA